MVRAISPGHCTECKQNHPTVFCVGKPDEDGFGSATVCRSCLRDAYLGASESVGVVVNVKESFARGKKGDLR